MERLFSPCTRLRDTLVESQGDNVVFRSPPELNLDVSTPELLSAERAFTYADLYAFLGNGARIAWLTPHAVVVREDGTGVCYGYWTDHQCRFCFDADGKEICVLARSPEHLLEISDVVLRLLAASAVHSVILDKWNSRNGALINAPSLAYLMEQCQSLNVLSFHDLTLDESHLRVLGAFSRPDLEIELQHCRITGAAAEALAKVLGRNQGPTKLVLRYIDNSGLTDGLRGNSRLKSFRPRLSDNCVEGNQRLLAIAGALKENKGLVDLDLEHNFRMSDETWGAVCDSLKTHPTLQFLDLCSNASVAPAVLKSRIQALLDMLKVNLSIHTVRLHRDFSQHELFRGSIIPYLETNWLRPRVRAIQKTRAIAYRAKVLGRALLAVRTDPNRFWMLLSGNAEVAFPSTTATTATTTPVANPPTPATVGATSNAAAVAATAAVTVTATRVA
jgi:hypothetical protein